ncbi:histidine kinase [Polaribacter pectinis]|uniref:Histidine kinase n=1 Tax=Polaribacter pectinis TaxID=2738844 RepID=A0A7G9LC81_9FLAO|nr:sensor histidine kinase [Polaribacter pectinis]QNM86230.1 histidine kinase [Polaribacter pectinis]
MFSKILILLLFFITVDGISQQNKLQHFTTENGLPSLTINDILQDEIGYLWLATNKGLVRFDGDEFRHLATHSLSKVNSLFFKNEILFIGQEKGLFKYQNRKFSYLGNEKVLKIISIDNRIILGTTEGIYEVKEDYLQPLQINPKIDFTIISDIYLQEKSILIATNKGLWSIDKIYKPSKIDKLLEGNIVSVLKKNNHLIVATKNNGIKIIDKNNAVQIINKESKIASIKSINNELWVSSHGNGISIFNTNDFTFKKRINKYNSAISNEINTVFKDNQNNIWIASNNNGLYKYNNNSVVDNQNKPKLFIEKIAVNYKGLNTLNSKKIELKPSENNISFSYKTVNLQQPKNIQYRYKLTSDFSPWSSKNNIEFANLNPGNYTFTVQSKNGKNVSEQKSISFFIDAPIYKKAWFIILCFALLLFVLSLIVDIYIRKLKKKNKQKITQLKFENHLLTLEQKALQLQMNPHFIFNVLNGIKALGNSGNTKELNKTVSQFSILLRSVLNNSRLDEISLKDEIETLTNYLDLEQKMSTKSFNYKIDTNLNNIDIEEILIPPMLMQPFVENAIKHGLSLDNKGEINIFFEVKQHHLECTITDNGIGFHQSKKINDKTSHKSVALKITKERIENLSKKGSFKIEEITKEKTVLGTKVWFKIPLKTDY